MIRKKLSFGVTAGSLSIAANGLSGLLVYPIILKTLSKEIAGLWFFFTSFTIIINLAKAGLAPIVMRRAAAIKSNEGSRILSDYVALIRRSFTIVSFLAFAICLVIYFSYVQWVLKENMTLYNDGLIAWSLFVCGNLINIYFSKNFYILNGFGEIGWDKVNQIIISIFTISGYFIVLNLGYALIGLSIVFVANSIIYAISSKFLLRRFTSVKHNSIKGNVKKENVIEIFKEGGEILVLNIIGILVMNKDVFLIERVLGLSILPAFTAMSRIQTITISISMLFPQMIFPFIAQNYAQSNYRKAKNLYWQGVLYSTGIVCLISLLFTPVAETIFLFWLGEGNFLGQNILILLFFLAVIYVHHNAHASAVISTSENSFVIPALINGLLSLPLAYLGLQHFGIEGMIIGNIIATIFPSIYVVNYSIKYFNKIAE